MQLRNDSETLIPCRACGNLVEFIFKKDSGGEMLYFECPSCGLFEPHGWVKPVSAPVAGGSNPAPVNTPAVEAGLLSPKRRRGRPSKPKGETQ